MKLTINGKNYDVELQEDAVVVGGATFKTVVLRDKDETTVRVAGRPYKVKFKDDQTVVVDGRPFTVAVSGQTAIRRPAAKAAQGPAKGDQKGAVCALMPGKVVSLRVKEGEQVAEGAVLLILEAMKMMNEVKAPQAGTVKRISVAPGENVTCGHVMVVIE